MAPSTESEAATPQAYQGRFMRLARSGPTNAAQPNQKKGMNSGRRTFVVGAFGMAGIDWRLSRR